MSKPAVKVCITGGAGQIAYSLIPLVCSGAMLGPDQPVILSLLDIEVAMGVLKGVVMEIEDCAYPLVRGVIATADTTAAFKDADICIMLGAFPRKEGMERKDLLAKNIGIFKEQGKAINDHAKRDVKVLVVGNPANTNCLICKHFAPSIPAENFSALTRLDHNRAKGQIAARTGVNVGDVHNLFIWGNHSSTQYPDVNHGYVVRDGARVPIRSALPSDYLNKDFISTVQKRGAAVIEARKLSSACSAANAVSDHIRDWVKGTAEGEYVSMAVMSEGSYDIPAGLMFSFPVTCSGGRYKIVQGLEVDQFSREKIVLTTKELEEEKAMAFQVIGQ